jgi:hypothetical protein
MIEVLFAAALAGVSAEAAHTTQSSASDVVTCVVNAGAMLRLGVHEFDQDATKGWRSITAKPDCGIAAADLIRDYRRANWGKLLPHELHLNYWHEGQVRASEGQTDRAVPLLLAGANPDSIDGFMHYAMATVAFLQRDLGALEAARRRLAALPEAKWFAEAKSKGQVPKSMKWPPNLDVVDGLIACSDKPYSEAYGHPSCRPGS